MSHTFRGQIRPRISRRKKWSQDATRNPIVMEDQHGRKWSASTEQKSGFPTGLISPLFKAPWYPHQKYFVCNPENVAELYIDYAQMFNDAKGANATFHKKAVKLSGKKGWPTPIRDDYSDDVTEALGEPPAPVQPILAAYQGNLFILGACSGCKRYSNECVCAPGAGKGYKATEPDPRLLRFMRRRRQELEEVVEGLDFSEASRQRALRDAGLAEVKVNGRRVLRDIEDAEMEGMDFRNDSPTPASEPELGAASVPGAAEPSEALSTEEAQTAVLEQRDSESPQEQFDAGLEDAVAEIEEEVDGGTTPRKAVPPQAADRVERQAPRRVSQSATRPKQGAHRSRVGRDKRSDRDRSRVLPSLRAKHDKRPSLADGVKPVVGGDSLDEE